MNLKAASKAILFGLLFLPFLANSKSATEYITAQDVERTIGKWQDIRQIEYDKIYNSKVSVTVSRDAVNDIQHRLIEGALPEKFGTGMRPAAVRYMIYEDLQYVLNEAFKIKVSSMYGSFGQFLELLFQNKIQAVEIDKRSIDLAFDEDGCRVVPCDPKKCDPNACAAASVKRSLPRGR